MSDAPLTIAAPPWRLIHFDVHCARCGHDLRGQTDPVCPACSLAFSWEQAAPLEHLTCAKCSYHLYGIADSRCPECGTPVDWNEALLRYRLREKPLFEYRWRDRPFRSFIRTGLLAFRPGRLWRTVDIHDPPQSRPLWAWTLIWLGMTAISLPIGLGVGVTLRNLARFFPQRQVSWDYILDYLIRSLTGFLWSPGIWVVGLMYALWWVFSLAALLLFQQSMRQCKVRSVHVLRVCAYGLTPLLLAFVFSSSFLTWVLPRQLNYRYGINLTGILAIVGFVWVVWCIRQAYRHYIRMPHSLGVAIVSQIIALLATVAIPPAIIYLLRSGW